MAVISQDQYNTVKQRYRRILIKVDLLNFDFQVVGSIEGNLITGGVSIDANSDVRRSCNITLVVKNHTLRIDIGGQIWLDKYIQIYYGIINNSNEEIIWTNMGIYLINNPNHVYDAVNNTITFNGLDLMAKISGTRNGYFSWLNGTIPQGEEIRGIFIDLLNQAGFQRYNIEELLDRNGNPITLPYEIEVSATSTLYSVFEEIRSNVLPNYEMFFDVDGVFNLRKIHNNASDPIIINNDILDKTILSIANDIDFENVKNVIEIWGQTLEPNYGNPICEYSTETLEIDGYLCDIDLLESDYILNQGYITFGINQRNTTNKPYLKINSFIPHPIVRNNSFYPFPATTDVTYYTIVYDNNTSFDSQNGIFNVITSQSVIPFVSAYHQSSPIIDGYSCTIPSSSLNTNSLTFGVNIVDTTTKPYLKINSLDPHPIVKNGDFYPFFLEEGDEKYYTVAYRSTTEFDSQTGVYEVVGEQVEITTCDNTFHSALKAVGYNCTISSLLDFYEIPQYSYIGFCINDINMTDKPYLKINNFESHPIVNEAKTAFVTFNKADYYIVIYDENTIFDSQKGVFYLIGSQQIYYIIKDELEDSPFNVNGTIGEILLPLSGGEYDNIATYQQAQDRAEWELYNYSRMNDRIQLTSVVIPWVDVNQKIEYINDEAEISGIFIIKSVSMDLAVEGTMTLECIRWYDYDPWDDE